MICFAIDEHGDFVYEIEFRATKNWVYDCSGLTMFMILNPKTESYRVDFYRLDHNSSNLIVVQ